MQRLLLDNRETTSPFLFFFGVHVSNELDVRDRNVPSWKQIARKQSYGKYRTENCVSIRQKTDRIRYRLYILSENRHNTRTTRADRRNGRTKETTYKVLHNIYVCIYIVSQRNIRHSKPRYDGFRFRFQNVTRKRNRDAKILRVSLVHNHSISEFTSDRPSKFDLFARACVLFARWYRFICV